MPVGENYPVARYLGRLIPVENSSDRPRAGPGAFGHLTVSHYFTDRNLRDGRINFLHTINITPSQIYCYAGARRWGSQQQYNFNAALDNQNGYVLE